MNQRRPVLICSGGDWCDASAEVLDVPNSIDMKVAESEYEEFLAARRRKESTDPYLTFTEWLKAHKNCKDSKVEVYSVL